MSELAGDDYLYKGVLSMKTTMDAEALNLLHRAGLNQYESRVYLSLLHTGSTSASDLSDTASIPRPRTYDVLDKLEKKGFIAVQPGRPTKFKAIDIKEAFANLRRRKESEVASEIDELKRLEEKFVERARGAKVPEKVTTGDYVWVLKDRANIYSKIEHMIHGAGRDITIATNERGLRRKLETHCDALRRARARGVSVRIIAPASNEALAKKAAECGSLIKRDNQHRFVIADDDVLLFLTPDDNDKTEVGAWIKSPFFAQNLRKTVP
jgi:sugar-specific transcriptional regulator TrmB